MPVDELALSAAIWPHLDFEMSEEETIERAELLAAIIDHVLDTDEPLPDGHMPAYPGLDAKSLSGHADLLERHGETVKVAEIRAWLREKGFNPDQPRDDHGRFGEGHTDLVAEQADVAEEKPSEKALRAKASHKLVDKKIQRYAEEYNEPRFAKVVNGISHPDSEPMDVTTENGDLVEMKTLIVQKVENNKITMDTYSQVRKIQKEKESGRSFHTVVCDDRLVMDVNGEDQHDESKRRYYYRRGVAGSARIGSLHECKDEKELLSLMAVPEEDLPSAAKRTDSKLRVGDWEAFKDEHGKGFKNSETGQVVRAKK